MSIIVLKAFREGPMISSSVMGDKAHLGIGTGMCRLIAAALPKLSEMTPVVKGITIDSFEGRPHPMARMLGMVETTPRTFDVYPIGVNEDDGVEVDLWVARSEGTTSIAYCKAESREMLVSEPDEHTMTILRFNDEDVAELVSVLNADYSTCPSIDDQE